MCVCVYESSEAQDTRRSLQQLCVGSTANLISMDSERQLESFQIETQPTQTSAVTDRHTETSSVEFYTPYKTKRKD